MDSFQFVARTWFFQMCWIEENRFVTKKLPVCLFVYSFVYLFIYLLSVLILQTVRLKTHPVQGTTGAARVCFKSSCVFLFWIFFSVFLYPSQLLGC